MRIRPSLLLVPLLTSACFDLKPLPFDLEGEIGDLVVGALTKNGVVERRFKFVIGDGTKTIHRAEDDDLHLFVVSRDDLVDTNGRPLDEATIAGAEVGRPGADQGCGRCLDAAPVRPQIVHGGDICSPPPFARFVSTVAGQARQPIAAELAVLWPGDCACAPAPAAPTEELEWTLLGPDRDHWPHDAIAGTSSATYALFAQHDSVGFVGGARRDLTPSFANRVRSAGGTTGGHIVAASVTATRPPGDGNNPNPDTTLHVFDDELQVVGTYEAPVLTASMRAGPDDRIFLIGEDGGNGPRVELCTVDGELSCTSVVPSAMALAPGMFDRSATDVVQFENGLTLFTFIHGLLVLEELPPPGATTVFTVTSTSDVGGVIRWDNEERKFFGSVPAFVSGSEPNTDSIVRTGYRLGPSTALLCLEQFGSYIAVVDVRPEHTRAKTGVVRVVANSPTGCGTFADELDGAGGVVGVRATFPNGDAVVVRPDETVVPAPPLELDGATSLPVRVETIMPSQTIAVLSDGDTFARSPGTTTFVRLIGEPRFNSRIASVDDDDGRIDVVYLDGRRDHYDGEVRIETRIGGLPTDGRILYRSGPFFVGDRDALRIGWIARTSDGTSLDNHVDLPSGVGVYDTVAVTDEIAILVTTQATLLRFRDGALENVVIDWDDPRTDGVETAPTTLTACGSMEVPHHDFRAAASIQGTTWVVGCDGVVLRVHAFANPPTATRYIHEIGATQLRSVSARCPDEIVIGASDVGGTDRERGSTWRLRPSAIGDDRLRSIDLLNVVKPAIYKNVIFPIGTIQTGGRTVTAYDTAVRTIGIDAVFDVIDRPSAIQTVGATVVFGTSGGRVYVGR